jgi:hypothetical protein
MSANGSLHEGYIQRLARQREEHRAIHDKKQGELTLPLADRISLWWDKLPAEERQQHYRMEFFVEKFSSAPRLIGPVLFELDWCRQRVWSKNRPHCRVWCPPEAGKAE